MAKCSRPAQAGEEDSDIQIIQKPRDFKERNRAGSVIQGTPRKKRAQSTTPNNCSQRGRSNTPSRVAGRGRSIPRVGHATAHNIKREASLAPAKIKLEHVTNKKSAPPIRTPRKSSKTSSMPKAVQSPHGSSVIDVSDQDIVFISSEGEGEGDQAEPIAPQRQARTSSTPGQRAVSSTPASRRIALPRGSASRSESMLSKAVINSFGQERRLVGETASFQSAAQGEKSKMKAKAKASPVPTHVSPNTFSCTSTSAKKQQDIGARLQETLSQSQYSKPPAENDHMMLMAPGQANHRTHPPAPESSITKQSLRSERPSQNPSSAIHTITKTRRDPVRVLTTRETSIDDPDVDYPAWFGQSPPPLLNFNKQSPSEPSSSKGQKEIRLGPMKSPHSKFTASRDIKNGSSTPDYESSGGEEISPGFSALQPTPSRGSGKKNLNSKLASQQISRDRPKQPAQEDMIIYVDESSSEDNVNAPSQQLLSDLEAVSSVVPSVQRRSTPRRKSVAFSSPLVYSPTPMHLSRASHIVRPRRSQSGSHVPSGDDESENSEEDMAREHSTNSASERLSQGRAYKKLSDIMNEDDSEDDGRETFASRLRSDKHRRLGEADRQYSTANEKQTIAVIVPETPSHLRARSVSLDPTDKSSKPKGPLSESQTQSESSRSQNTKRPRDNSLDPNVSNTSTLAHGPASKSQVRASHAQQRLSPLPPRKQRKTAQAPSFSSAASNSSNKLADSSSSLTTAASGVLAATILLQEAREEHNLMVSIFSSILDADHPHSYRSHILSAPADH